MAKKEIKTQAQLDKESKNKDLKERLQKFCDKSGKISMSEFMKNWNLKNKEKITEMVKLNDTILVRFGNNTLHIFTNNLYL